MNKKKILQSKSEITLRNIVIVAFILFNLTLVIFPILTGFIGSFHEWNPLVGTFKFKGIDNYIALFKSDLFWTSMINTIIFCIFVVFFRIVFGLGIANIIHSKLIKRKSIFRTLFYMPTVTPLVAVAYVWKLIYNPQFGLLNSIFNLNINWLFDSKYALVAVMIMTVWKDFGYAVVLFLSGLASVPTDTLEAADMDGANSFQKFFKITLPLLKPTTLLVIVTSLISYLQTYISVLVMTEGGPGTSTNLLSYVIFDEAFKKYNFGYASAIAVILFILTAALSVISFKISGDKEESNV